MCLHALCMCVCPVFFFYITAHKQQSLCRLKAIRYISSGFAFTFLKTDMMTPRSSFVADLGG